MNPQINSKELLEKSKIVRGLSLVLNVKGTAVI